MNSGAARLTGMQRKDIKVGETYYCKIGDSRHQVVVVGEVEVDSKCSRWRVRRVGESKDLPKLRTSSAIHTSKY